MALEEVFGGGLEELSAHAEALVDRMELTVLLGHDERVQVLQQYRIQLGDGFRRAIVTLHELLAREPVGRIAETDLRGKRRLVVKQQAVLAASGDMVQTNA